VIGGPLAVLCDILSGCRHDLPLPCAEHVVALAREHRVDRLLAWRTGSIDEEMRREALVDELHVRELNRVLAALETAGVRPLVFKGAALAHSLYPESWLRPRLDADILIPERARAAAFDTLERLGYDRSVLIDGALVMAQAPFGRVDDRGQEHALDVHWRVANPQLLATVLTYDDLERRAATLVVRGQTMRVPCAVDALLLACVHRAAHHAASNELLWLYDIHLLASGMHADDWRSLQARAGRLGVAAICSDGLRQAADRFGTPMSMAPAVSPTGGEPSAVYLRKELGRLERLALDLQAIPFRARWRLVREHVLPSRRFMRQRYGRQHDAVLPVLYLRRVVSGALRWLLPSA
jgi:hypothetical protein